MRRWLMSCWALVAVGAAGGGKIPVAVVDDVGKEVALNETPGRIVSLAPSTTELLFVLGVGNRVVGATQSCNYPPEALQIERVASFKSMNLELIMALQPDLAVAARGNDMQAVEALRSAGIPVFILNIQTFPELYEGLRRLGRLTGTAARGEEVATALQRREEHVAARLDSITRRPRVMWGYWGEIVYTAGKGSFIDRLIGRAGGVNVAGETDVTWPQVGLEVILSWEPEVLLTTHLPAPATAETLAREIDRLQATDGWRQLPAVRERRVYYVEPDWLMRPGPRLLDALEQTAELLHPTAVGTQ